MEFIKNELINSVLEKYFETFSKTLDTADYVPEKYGKKIHKYIFKNMKCKFKEVDRVYAKQKKGLANGQGGEGASLCGGASLRPSHTESRPSPPAEPN